MEFLNEATGEWEQAPRSVDVTGLRERTEEHPTLGMSYPNETVLALLRVLEAAQALDAKYDAGVFGDAEYQVLRSVFGETLDDLHDAVGRFVS